jgi:biotin synthase
VRWPTLPWRTVLEAMERTQDRFGRVCISMITRRDSADALIAMASSIRERLDTPISGLLSPSVLTRDQMAGMRQAGVDRIGIAVDAATPELFDAMRGRAIEGPHRWETYWERFDEGIEVFGRRMVGCHLICGLGETEREMALALQHVRDAGGLTHLFSFYPEAGSPLEDREPPPMGQYRRIQLARHLIDEGIANADAFCYDEEDRITSFGVTDAVLEEALAVGTAFETSGCPGLDGRVACNRPFANSRPGPDIRNYPFPLEPGDVAKVRQELWSR